MMRSTVFFWNKEQKLTPDLQRTSRLALLRPPVPTMAGLKFRDRVFQGAIHITGSL